MIKRILALGIIGSVLAGGAAIGITGNINHQKASNHVVLSRHISNTKKTDSTKVTPPLLNMWQYVNNSYLNGNNWTYGVNNSNQAQSVTTTDSIGWLYSIAGVANANNNFSYGDWASYHNVSSVAQPNLSGPNTYEAGMNNAPNEVQWYNEYNNSGAPVAQSQYYHNFGQ